MSFFETQCILYEVGCELLTQSVYLRVLFLLSGLNTESLFFSVFLFIVRGGSRGVTPMARQPVSYYYACGWVAEWLACWTQAQKARVQIAVATLLGNSFTQTVHTHCAPVHQAAKLVAALLRAAGRGG